jgi:hypothetical protein
LAGLGIRAGAFVACDVSIREGNMSVDVLTAEARDEWTRRYPLKTGGRVEMVNVGPINVTAGEPGFVNFRVTRTAKALTEEAAKEIVSNIEIQETADSESIRVVTRMSRTRTREPRQTEVSYEVQIPAGAQVAVTINNGPLTAARLNGPLKASVVNGTIELSDIAGEIDATAVNGGLTAKLSRITAAVRLEATNGRISFEIPKGAKANLSARSVNGGISVTGLDVQSPTGRRIRDLEAALNGGGPDLDLRVTNGRISITGR